MHSTFARLLDTKTKRMNSKVCRGLASTYIPLAPQWLDTVFRSTAKSFPVGLKYEGYTLCTPQEKFNILSNKDPKRTYDLAASYLYMIKIHSSFEGVALPVKYLMLPFVEEGGLTYIGGSLYSISPVLADKMISPERNRIFVRLMRDKTNFERTSFSMVVNNRNIIEQVIYANIYRNKADSGGVHKAASKSETTALHYLFAKYGFYETFRKYVKFEPIVGMDKDITSEHYPEDKYVICRSVGNKPKTCLDALYTPCKIRVAIPIEHWDSTMQGIMTSLFYSLDHFPTQITPANIDSVEVWRMLLGQIIFGHKYSNQGTLLLNIKEHFTSLDEYVDDMVRLLIETQFGDKLGMRVNTFYDLLFLMIKHFNSWVILNNGVHGGSDFEKRLEVLYYILYDTVSKFNKMSFNLNRQSNSRKLSYQEVAKHMSKALNPGIIFHLTKSNLAVAPAAASVDNMYRRLTSNIALQMGAQGAKRGSKNHVSTQDPHLQANARSLGVGSIVWISKANMTPDARINPWAEVDIASGTLSPAPDTILQIEKVQQTLSDIQVFKLDTDDDLMLSEGVDTEDAGDSEDFD